MTIGQVLPILVCAGLWLLPTAAQDSSSYGQKTRTFHSEADFKRTAVGRVTIVRTADRQRLAALLEAGLPLPRTNHLGPRGSARGQEHFASIGMAEAGNTSPDGAGFQTMWSPALDSVRARRGLKPGRGSHESTTKR